MIVTFECGDEAVVSILSTGKTEDKILGSYVLNIRMLAATFDVNVRIYHLPGVESSVDLLSR